MEDPTNIDATTTEVHGYAKVKRVNPFEGKTVLVTDEDGEQLVLPLARATLHGMDYEMLRGLVVLPASGEAGTVLHVPVIKSLYQKLLAAILKDPSSFDMGYWHGADYQKDPTTPLEDGRKLLALRHRELAELPKHYCKTSHCHAGYVVALAGNAGWDLEEALSDSPDIAANLILAKSCPWMDEEPSYNASDDDALREIRLHAALEQLHELGFGKDHLEKIAVEYRNNVSYPE